MFTLIHIVMLKETEKVFVACREGITRKFSLFLVDIQRGAIAKYHSCDSLWKEILDATVCAQILNLVSTALEDRSVPIFQMRGDEKGLADLLNKSPYYR